MLAARLALLLVPLSAEASAVAAGTPIPVTPDDLAGRPYHVVADLSARAHKATLFSHDPTPADVDRKLRAQAERLGADAVILVRYGTVGVGATSWGVLEGRGRAIRFDR
jgi:hypothetical protein